MSLLAAQRYAFGRAIAMVRDRPVPFLLGVLLAASALALPLALGSIVWAARPVLAQLQPSPEISVYVSTRATMRDVEIAEGAAGGPPRHHGREVAAEGRRAGATAEEVGLHHASR